MSSVKNNKVKYILFNRETGVRIECTDKVVLGKWLARGFEIERIEIPEN